MEKSTQQWFKEMLYEFKDDPQFKAEEYLLALEFEIENINGQLKGYKAVLFWLLEYCANKLINGCK